MPGDGLEREDTEGTGQATDDPESGQLSPTEESTPDWNSDFAPPGRSSVDVTEGVMDGGNLEAGDEYSEFGKTIFSTICQLAGVSLQLTPI